MAEEPGGNGQHLPVGEDRILSIHDLAAYLSIPIRTLYQMAAHGTIPGAKVGRHWRFSRRAIDRWLTQRSGVQRRSVLVVDDDPLVGELFDAILSDDGYAVTAATDAISALQLLREREFTSVFLDVVMPDADSLALLAELRAVRPSQRVIVMTAHADSELVAAVLALGPVTLLQKPFSRQHIRATLQHIGGG